MADKPTTDTLPETGEEAKQEQEQPQAATQEVGSEAKFTQADLDRILKERLDREKAKTKEALSKLAELEQAKARLAELEQANLSEEEKRQQHVATLEQKLADAEAKASEALTRANGRLVLAAVLTSATEAGFLNPADAYSLLDPNSVQVDDDGNVTGAADAVAALAKAKPYLLRAKTAPNINAAPAGATPTDLPRLTPEQEKIARRQGITPEQYARRLAERQAIPRR